ncbi:MAG: AAA family ATPase [Bryobacteraceae bacterium]
MVFHLEFEGIRCFRRKQRVRIAPLTLLVGENSSGKSTVLAVAKIAMDLATSRLRQPFNDPPFLLGAYDDIAFRDRAGKPAKQFKFAIEERDRLGFRLLSEWSPEGGHPAMDQLSFSKGDVSVNLARPRHLNGDWLTTMVRGFAGDRDKAALLDMGAWLAQNRSSFAMAPIRSSPRRTYDPVIPERDPEGSHVPQVLARRLSSRDKPSTDFRRSIGAFGRQAKLFEDLLVERKGRNPNDPFQIRVVSAGVDANLIDVGYGISQVLPILVETLMRPQDNSLLLLQQPEVHLHPQAQAALGTLFARSAKAGTAHLMVETHSDHLIDRVRIAVRERVLRPDQVSLLYFEKKRSEAMIHELVLDAEGQITNPPPGYRQFFLNEANRVLGID